MTQSLKQVLDKFIFPEGLKEEQIIGAVKSWLLQFRDELNYLQTPQCYDREVNASIRAAKISRIQQIDILIDSLQTNCVDNIKESQK